MESHLCWMVFCGDKQVKERLAGVDTDERLIKTDLWKNVSLKQTGKRMFY